MSRTFQQSSLIGEYRVVDYLGEGGMGQVYRAVHSKIGRVVAVKALTNAGHSLDSIERFLNEACIQSRLQHPNIATLYDFVECEGQPCIIMEYVDGQTLYERIREAGALPLHEAVHILQKVAEAIAYIHENSIVHRDIKSHNVKITSRRQVKLLDFGIARGESSQNMTQVGAVIGTPLYLSPEQLRGERADARSDIWALGILFYEMLTGNMPFSATTFGELYERVTTGSYPPPTTLNRAVPRAAEAVIVRCLKKHPAERYQSAQDLLHDLSKLAATVPRTDLGAPEPPPSPRPQPPTGGDSPGWARRNWVVLAAGGSAAVVVLLVASAFGLIVYMDSDDGAAKNTPPRPAPTQQKKLASTNARPGDEQTRTVPIMTTDGKPAEVWRIDPASGEGVYLGQTPYNYEGRFGDKVKLMLKRDGFNDKAIEFDVRDSDQPWSITMETKK